MATAARNSTKADGDVIGGRTAQANGKPGDCGACVDRGPELFANRDSYSKAQCSAVQRSAVRWLLRCLERYGGRREKRNLERFAVVGVR